EDEPNNTTRFLVLGDSQPRPSGRDKTSLVLSARNRAGAVYEMLTPFATRGVSMTKFESRPSRVALWEYLFFVDIEGHRDDANVAEALAEVHYYPDGSGFELKAILARKLVLPPANFVLGNGSNDVLELAARAFLTAADSAVYAEHAFMVYPLAVQAIGARHLVVPARSCGADLAGVLKAIRAGTKVV